jgi:hypothetical protein
MIDMVKRTRLSRKVYWKPTRQQKVKFLNSLKKSLAGLKQDLQSLRRSKEKAGWLERHSIDYDRNIRETNNFIRHYQRFIERVKKTKVVSDG